MIYYYDSFSDDFLETKNNTKKLPENHLFIHKNPVYNFFAAILYFLVKTYARFYAKFFLHLKIVNHNRLKNKHGYFIYSNHTQKLGDVFNPFIINFSHPYIICNQSNLGIPILGPLLPMAGALPIPDSISGKKRLFSAISERYKQKKAIVFYPEAHLWPYYTKIRPFESSAFVFPAKENAPVFVATTVYKKSKTRKKPSITIYIDGPIKADPLLSKKERAEYLKNQVQTVMTNRAKLSNYEYIKYQKRA